MKDDNLELLAAALQHDMTLPFAPERPERRPRIIRLAAMGYRQAHYALMVYAEMLREAGEPLPEDLQDYVSRMALLGFKPAKRMGNIRRDMAICDAISTLYEARLQVGERYAAETGSNAMLEGVLLDRGPATDEDSCISLVWKALNRINVYLSEDAVRKIWQRKWPI